MTDPAALLKSLSDPVRLRLLRLLAQDELNVRELVAITGLSQPRVSKHLGILRHEGWVTQRRQGTWIWYRLVERGKAPGGAGLLDEILTLAEELAAAEQDNRGLASVVAARQLRTRDFFADMADRWEAVRRHYARQEFDLGMMGTLAEPGVRVLDVGTGTGSLLSDLAAAGARVLALDLSLPMLARARTQGRARSGGEIAYCCGAAEALPLPDGVCDVVHCAMVLQHVARPARVVAELARVLRPGGRVAVTSFCAHHQEWMRSELAHQWLGFTHTEMDRFFMSAGLRPVNWLQRGPRPADGPGNGQGSAPSAWPEVFLMTGVLDADHGGIPAHLQGE